MIKRIGLCLLVILVLLALMLGYQRWHTHHSTVAFPPGWQVTTPGMEVRQCSWHTSSDDVAELLAVRIDPARCAIRVLDARPGGGAAGNWAEMICPRQGAVINGCFFGDNHQPIGLLVVDGQVRQRDVVRQDFATFQLRGRRPEIVDSSAKVARGVTQALECKPRLLVNGRSPHFKPQGIASRAAIGITASGRVVLAATGSLITLEEWASCLREQCGCVNALNLDGGPSTQLTVQGKVNAEVHGGSSVPVFLVVTPGTGS